MLAAVTGWDFDEAFLKQTGMRIFNMRHAFNLREGQNPSDVVLPRRLVGEPAQTEGPWPGLRLITKRWLKIFSPRWIGMGKPGNPVADRWKPWAGWRM